MPVAAEKTCTTCTRETDNVNFNCPVKGDYRLFTDWRPRCATQYQDMVSNQLPSSLDQRMFLTHNADQIMKDNTLKAYLKAGCGPCVDNPSWDDGTMLRELDSQQCNSRTCSFRVNDPWGLGRQRKYYDDDQDQAVRQEFVKQKERENAMFKQTAQCCGTVTDDLMYYPIGGGTQTSYMRSTVPSGASSMSGGGR